MQEETEGSPSWTQNMMAILMAWKKRILGEREANEVENRSQIHTKGFNFFPPLSWANRILPSQVQFTHSLPSLPINFVNIDKLMSKVLFRLESNQILGIVGMGGSGKTTLTKAILHRVHLGFESTSFVANMRDSKNVLDIQRQLLIDLKYERSISTMEEGFKCLQNIFEKKKVFVVFDDVASQEQLQSLVSSTWVFANGSKIIATSRNWQDLKTTCKSHTGKMDMELLDEDQAKELFCKHAFLQQKPQGPQFEEVANKVIQACGGLPLSLEVLGSYLCGVQRLRVWQLALQTLQRGQCLVGSWDNERIWRTLKISYDNLNEDEKNMFLDIACFFCRDVLKEGMQAEKALRIWDCDDNNAHSTLLNLMDRGLVRIDSDGMLAMHDHLRDMGRMIACTEPIGGQRIWNLDEFKLTKLDACMMIQNVEGLHMVGSHCNYNMIIALDMVNIRLLHMNNCENLDYCYKRMTTASKLRWMRINMSYGENRVEKIEELQPSFFIPFKQLRVLELERFVDLQHLPLEIGTLKMLKYLTLIDCWELQSVPKALGNLTSLVTLDLSGCMSLRTLPKELGNLTSLVALYLNGCLSLQALPEALGNLFSLVTLDLGGCKSLTTIPEALGNLTSLATFHLSGCESLTTVPEALGNLTSLATFHLSGCESLTTLPEALGNLTSLATLDLSGCESLTTLPEALGNLTSLATLDLSGCKSLTTLSEALGNLTSLATFHLSGCESLTTVPEALGNLTSLATLDLSGCKSLTTLPEALGNLTSLATLDLSGCKSLTTLPEALGNLTSLATLDLSGCKSLTTLPEALGNLTSLATFHLSGCESLTTLPEALGNLTSLATFHLSGCESLTTLPEALGNLTSLATFHLSGCKSLTTLPEALGNLTSLATLDLSHCTSLTTVPEALGNLTSLATLDLSGCKSLTTLPEALGNLTSLATFHLSGCKSLTTIPEALGNLTSLATLDLSGCKSLTTLPEALGNLTSLATFHLSGCKSLTTIPEAFGNLTSLATFHLSGCESLTTVPEALGNLTSLATLDLSGCTSLTTLPEALGNLTSLATLDLSGCESLTTLPEALGNLTSLATLDLSGCESLTTLPEALGNLTSLATLDLSHCTSLTTVPEGLGNLTSLAIFHLSGCKSLTTLPVGFGNLTSLATLDLSGCTSLTTIPEGFGNLTSMGTLELRGCTSLTTLDLHGWKNLKEIPEALGELSSLVTLDLHGCKNLKKIPEALGNLSSLVTLDLHGCENLKEIPEALGNLSSLVTLDLHGCENLKEIPEALGKLSSLVTLDLHGCKNLKKIPEALGNLSSLVTLDLHGCENLKEIPEALGNLSSLVTLDLHGCKNLKEIPKALGLLSSLLTLDLSGCSNLKELPETLGNLTSLVTLDLSGCLNLKEIPETLGNLTSLVTLDLSSCENLKELPKTLGNLNSLVTLYLEGCLGMKGILDLGAADNLTEPGNSKSQTSSNESLDQAQHDPMEPLGKPNKARRGSDRSTLTLPRIWQPPIAVMAFLGLGIILLNWLAYFIYGFPHSFVLALFITLLVALFVVIMLLSEEISSLVSLLSLGHVTGIPWDVVSFAVIMIAMVCILKPSSSIFFFVNSTALGVGLLVLILEMRRSVHLCLLWYNTTGKSLRPCNMLKSQYYSQNLRGALFISKDAPDGCWSYHPDFSLTGQRRENDKDLEDEFEVSGFTYKCRYQYPTSFFEVTMQGKSIKSMETRLEPEVHDMFIRLIRRWKHKAEDGVFYGMQRIWGVNVTHCLEVEELYKLLVEGHVPVQYVNGPYTKALVMGEKDILYSIRSVILTIIVCCGAMYVTYEGHVVVKGIFLTLSLIAGGLLIRALHLTTYMDVESKIFSYKYLYWFKYWEYRGQVLCLDRYCMELPKTLGNLKSLVTLYLEGCLGLKGILDLGAAGNLTEPGNSKSQTSSNESLDQAQHDPMEPLGKPNKARRRSDRSTLTLPRIWQPPIAVMALLGLGIILLNWLAYFIYGFPHSFVLALFITLLVALFVVIMLLSEEISSLVSLLSLGHVTGIPWDVVSFAVIMIAMVCILKPPSSIFFFVSCTALGVGLLVLILEMRRSVHLRLLWYNTTGKSLRPCNMLKSQYYSQNLRGALFISKDAPDGCWSYHPNFSLTGQRRENDKDLEDEFEVSGFTYKCRYQYPTSFFEVTMRGKSIKSMETRLEPEVHDMFIRLIRRWKHKAEDGVFYGMQRIWGVNVTHCLEVEELYKLLVEGHVPVQYVNGPYTKALVMGEKDILDSIRNVILIIIACCGAMYVTYEGHVAVKWIVLPLSLIVGGLLIRALHLTTYMDVESKIFSYKYLYWFKYWEYRGQVLCPDRYCMEVMGHPVHVEGGTHYAELTKDPGYPIFDSTFTSIDRVPFYRVEIGKCTCMLVRIKNEPGFVKFFIKSTVHHSTCYSYLDQIYKDLFYKEQFYKKRMSETCEERIQTLLTWWAEGKVSFVSSEVIREGRRIAHCTSLLDIFLWFVGGPYRSLDDNSDCHTFRVHELGYGFENGLWLVHDR